jgi:type IV secretory pathway component VirB8
MNLNKLKSSPFPKMMGELNHMNQFLKMFSFATLIVALASLGLSISLADKGPVVLTLNTEGKVLEKTALPKVENLIKEGITRYIEKRYNWTPVDVQNKFKDSSFFVSPTSQKAFHEAMKNVIRFSTEKQVAQKVYLANVEINIKDGIALITGDRVTSIQGLKAAGNLKLQLNFENGPRTQENPWGVYITKEKEEQ